MFGTAAKHAVVAALSWLSGWSVGRPRRSLSCYGFNEGVGESFEHGSQIFGLNRVGGRCGGSCSRNVGRCSAVGGHCSMQDESGRIIDVLEVVWVIWEMIGKLQL